MSFNYAIKNHTIGTQCAAEFSQGIVGKQFEEVDDMLREQGHGEIADTLGDYWDVYTECAVEGCRAYFSLSNQAGEITILYNGIGLVGCKK